MVFKIHIAATAAVLVASTAPAQAQTLRIGAVGVLSGGVHRDLQSGASAAAVSPMVLRGMTYFDEDVRMACALCETFPTVANGGVVEETTPEGGRGQAVTYRLKAGLAWDDGAPVTARDFVLAWRVGGREDSAYVWRNRLADEIWSVEALDDRTVVVHRRGQSCLPGDFRFSALPSHLMGPGEKTGDLYGRDPAARGLYNGPYRVAAYANDRVVLARNPHWKGASPAYERIELVLKPDQAALQAAMIAGDIDFLPNASLATADAVSAAAAGKFNDVRRDGRVLLQVSLNLDDPLVSDVRVRQALMAALDREGLAASFGRGAAPALSFVTRGFPWFDPSVPDRDNRPQEARRLLDAAGWRSGADGVRRNAAGRPLKLRLAVQRGHMERPFVGALIESWRRIGVEAVIEPWGGIGQHTGDNPPTMALFGYTLEGGANIDQAVFSSASIPKPGEVRNGLNIFRYRNAQVDEAVEKLSAGCPTDVGPMYATLQRRSAEDLPFLPLFFAPEAHLIPPGMTPPAKKTVVFMLPDDVETWPAPRP